MPAKEIVDDYLLDGVHRLVSHPVAAYLVRPEGIGWEPVGVEAAVAHALEAAGQGGADSRASRCSG